MTDAKQPNIEERVLGLLMGVGLGVVLGFFLRHRQELPPGR